MALPCGSASLQPFGRLFLLYESPADFPWYSELLFLALNLMKLTSFLLRNFLYLFTFVGR